MKAAMISMGSKSSLMALEAMKKYFSHVDNIDVRNVEVMLNGREIVALWNGKPMEGYNCIYAKGSFRYSQLLRSITTNFYDAAYMPIAPNAFTVVHDKMLTHLALQYNKIPMPETYIVSNVVAAKKILSQTHYPIILKFPHGTQGKGVMFAESYAAASSMLDALDPIKKTFLIQEYIETGGVDIRAFVIGDKVAASMKRKAIIGEKRANMHAGGTGEAVLLDDQTKKIAVRTAKSLGAEICAVDILETVKGPVVIEANISPGLRGITSVTKIDVADKIAKYLFDRAKEFSEKGRTTETSKLFVDLNVNEAGKPIEQQIVTNLDLRGERILLPKIITSIAKLDEKDEVIVKASKGKISVERI